MSVSSNNQRYAAAVAEPAEEIAQSQTSLAGPTDQNPISCNICNRSYARLDHLARHIRIHTKEKPFACDVCHKSFSRIDVLKRHIENHSSEKPAKRARTAGQATSHRVARACRPCAEAKLKCSESHPCERCTSKGITCVLESAASSMGDGSIVPSEDLSVAMSTHHDPFDDSSESRIHLTQYNHTEDYGIRHSNDIVLSQTPDPSALADNQGHDAVSYVPRSLHPGSPRNFQDLMMVDFMYNVMNQEPFDPHFEGRTMEYMPDILDFSFDDAYDFSINDIFMPHPNDDRAPAQATSGAATPAIQKLASLGQQAFQDSMWLWTPAHDDHSRAEQANLSLPTPELMPGETIDIIHHLSLASRDRILASVLSTCAPPAQRQVVSCFPSAEMLSKLLSISIVHHSHRFAPYVHAATIDVGQESDVFLLALIAFGATLSSHSNVRKLGYAMQEALRIAMQDTYERDNTTTRDLRTSQAFAMQLEIGLWSGNRRKMEIAESFALPLVTMLRRGGRLKQKLLVEVIPFLEDDLLTTERKWRKWAEHESFKRLVYHQVLTDTGSSFSLMSQPLISYAEIGIDLPSSQDLWQAVSAQEWKRVYLAQHDTTPEQNLSFRSVLSDLSQMTPIQSSIDVRLSLAVIVSTVWSRVWQCLQMKSLSNYQSNVSGGSNMLTVNTFYQELVHTAKNVSLRSADWAGGLGPYAELLLDLCMMHLHVSLEAVQLLAGKSGEEEARRVVPTLRRWIESAESRQAIFHAGRVLAAARRFRFGHLRDHSAVAIYHASLAMWAYAVISEIPLQSVTITTEQPRSTNQYATMVLLDSVDSPELQRFLVLGVGVPAISSHEDDWSTSPTNNNPVPLSDTLAAMTSVANLLASKNGDEQSRPPMVANLSKLILALGKATAVMKKKGT